MSKTAERILVTGASGFIGSFIVEEALRRGMEVWAAVRATSSRQWLTDPRIRFLELDLRPGREEALRQTLAQQQFHYVVHAAGATKCLHPDDFRLHNTLATRHLVQALTATQHELRRFVFMSSLSVCGAICEEEPHREIREDDIPRPNTRYGQSKLAAEQELEQLAAQGRGLPYVVLRLTGVYGPREKDYLQMVKSIAGHVDFAVGYRRQDITFVYVDDVVQAVMLALTRGADGRKYFISDGQVYLSDDFSRLVRRELGHPFCLRVKAPLWVLRMATTAGQAWGQLTRRPQTLNNDKYHILSQRNWMCDITPARRELGYEPQWPLERGVVATVAWYREHGWI